MMLRRWYAYYVELVCRRRSVAAIALGLLCIWPTLQSIKLFSSVKADLQELLPRDSQATRSLNVIHERIASQGHITVVAHGTDPGANRAFIDSLATHLRKSQSPLIAWVQSDVRDERDWLRLRSPLLMPRETFEGLIDDVNQIFKTAKARANPLFVAIEEDNDDEWQVLRADINEVTSAKDRFTRGYLETGSGDTVVAIVWLRGSDVDIDVARKLKRVVALSVERVLPRFQGKLKVGYTGDAANFIEEHDAVIEDLSLTSLVVVVLVTALIAAYFRSVRSVVVVITTLIPGLLVTFGVGRLLVGHLNSNTAFLGSIIAGNGINYPLVLLSFYRRREATERVPNAIVAAAIAALPGTLGAAATASAAYAGLAASGFRGFSQFGYLGGLGMLATWALTYVAAPIAIAWMAPARLGQRATRVEISIRRFFRTPLLAKAMAVLLLSVAGITAAVGMSRAQKEGVYEMRLDVLRNRRSLANGSASWDETMGRLFGSWVNPVVALVDADEKRELAANALRGSLMQPQQPLVDRIETIETFVPPQPDQRGRLAKLQDVKGKLAQLQAEVPNGQVREYLDLWLSDKALRPITIDEIPRTLLRNTRERDGDVGKTILIYPSSKVDYVDGRNMIRLATAINETALPQNTVVGGPFLFMASVFELVHKEAPDVVLVVFALVLALLCVLYFRKPRRIVLCAVIVGPVALIAQLVVLAMGIRVNMLNFAAVPITIGVGADYVLNLFGAMDSLGMNAKAACARMGGAILLCSMTTIVGYGSLLMAYSGALRSFGWAAVVGEVMVVATVLVVLPAFENVSTAPTMLEPCCTE